MVVRSYEIEAQTQLWEKGAYPIGTQVEFSDMEISHSDGRGGRLDYRTFSRGVLIAYDNIFNHTHLIIQRADENYQPYGPPKVFNVDSLRRLIESVEPLPGSETIPAEDRHYFIA